MQAPPQKPASFTPPIPPFPATRGCAYPIPPAAPSRPGFGPRPAPPPPPQIASPWIDYLEDLVASGGPEPAEYPRLNQCFADVVRLASHSPAGAELVAAVRSALAPTFLKATVLGFARLRPHGHPGDFELVERLLSYHHSPDPNLVRWDAYAHALPVVRALRNRAAHLRGLLDRLEAEGPAQPCHVLHFGSGPGRELADYFIARGADSRLRADCVDPDPMAAPHGRRVVARMTDRVTFHASPLLAFRPSCRYRLAWVSTLCEDLSDRALVVILCRLARWLEPGGRIVCCQMAEPDHSDPLIQVVADWKLVYRDAPALLNLAARAGFPPDRTRVVRDPQYPNLYLQLTCPPGKARRVHPGGEAGRWARASRIHPADFQEWQHAA